MAIKFQYNKTSLQQLEKQLKVRVRTLPIIKNKESALRMEVKRCKTEAADLEDRLEQQIQAYEAMFALWNEFDASLIKVYVYRFSKISISRYVRTVCLTLPNGMPTVSICWRNLRIRQLNVSLCSPS